jgi:catechol 2,3-dioxygenase-like lactoylglutathione lyase family enzyme
MSRGIEHIGITVADALKAENFFEQVFGAEVLYRIIPYSDSDKQMPGAQMQTINGFPPELNVVSLSMLRLQQGPNIEIFQVAPSVTDHNATIGQSGINHFSIYTDDILATGEKMRAHGATMFDGPQDCFSYEEGAGNQIWFGLTPFGLLIELISLPSGVQVEQGVSASRWIPNQPAAE